MWNRKQSTEGRPFPGPIQNQGAGWLIFGLGVAQLCYSLTLNTFNVVVARQPLAPALNYVQFEVALLTMEGCEVYR